MNYGWHAAEETTDNSQDAGVCNGDADAKERLRRVTGRAPRALG